MKKQFSDFIVLPHVCPFVLEVVLDGEVFDRTGKQSGTLFKMTPRLLPRLTLKKQV